jgi:hypothetical protein
MIKKTVFILMLIISVVNLNGQNKDWWKGQVGTGPGNCGPACAAMAIKWAKKVDIKVEQIRKIIGYSRPDGATSFDELTVAMLKYGVKSYMKEHSTLKDLIDLVSHKKNIVIVCLTLKYVDKSDGNQFGRNHNFDGGHYIVLVDYIGGYFVCQDPMPNGDDRCYLATQIWHGMTSDNTRILVVSKE